MRAILWLLALPMAVWAQLDDNTLTVTASRQLAATLQPDQAVFVVYVNAPTNASLDDVLAALPGAGISAANLANAFTNLETDNPSTWWAFVLTVPIDKLGSTIATLQSDVSTSTLQVRYSVSTQVSAALQATQQCPYTALVSDATAEAQKLAVAAGAAVGPILSVSDGSTIGVPRLIAALLTTSTVNPYIPPAPDCTMTVQFSLVH
jgi:Protein of unknown function (DUF541)